MNHDQNSVMIDDVAEFCVTVNEKLEMLQSRMMTLKLNIGTSWHYMQERLEEVRRECEERKPAIAEARARREQWGKDEESESKGPIDQWSDRHATRNTTAPAQDVEEIARLAIMVAEASIDDVERMVLEALSARRDVEAVTWDEPNVAVHFP